MKGSGDLRAVGFSIILVMTLLTISAYPGLTISTDEPDISPNFFPFDIEGQVSPMPDIPELEDHRKYFSSNELTYGTPGLVFLLVHTNIYSSIYVDVMRYKSDIENDGYTVEVYSEPWADHLEVRAFLQSGFARGMQGAVLIGDIPTAIGEIANDFGEYGYVYFPIDLFYMDLDGAWIDNDGNDFYDDHNDGTGDVEADVWVGRIYASTLSIQGKSEEQLLHEYFVKNHEYRMGNLSLYDRALLYIDDDWEPWDDTHDYEISLRYENRTMESNPETTIASDYMSRILSTYDYMTYRIDNETVYGPSIGGDTGPFSLDYRNIEDCSLYVDMASSGFVRLAEGVDYELDYASGALDLSPMGYIPPAWTFYAYYNFTISKFLDNLPNPVGPEIVVGPTAGGETGPFYLEEENIIDLQLYQIDNGSAPFVLAKYVDYFLDNETGLIDISPIAPLAPNTTLVAFYNYSNSSSGFHDWVALFAHSAWYYHGFYYNSATQWDYLYNTEISNSDITAHFYNLFCCSGARYIEYSGNGCLAGHYTMAGTHSIASIGSTKTGSMLNFDDFYWPLSQGASIGEAFLTWFQLNGEYGAGDLFSSRCWFYGMTICGDPTIDTFDNVRPEPPKQIDFSLTGDDVHITWKPSPSPDIHHYELFRSTDPESFDFDVPFMSTKATTRSFPTTFIDYGAGTDGIDYYYVLRAVDYANNNDGNTDVHAKYHSTLIPGSWNLISLPLASESQPIEDALASLNYSYVKYYDSNQGWQSYAPHLSESIITLHDIDRTQGIWVMTGSDYLVHFGRVPGTTQIQLKAGWNLVGMPCTSDSMTIANGLWGTGANAVESFDMGHPYMLRQMSPTECFQPGNGYWIRVPADVIWTIDW